MRIERRLCGIENAIGPIAYVEGKRRARNFAIRSGRGECMVVSVAADDACGDRRASCGQRHKACCGIGHWGVGISVGVTACAELGQSGMRMGGDPVGEIDGVQAIDAEKQARAAG